MAVTALEVMTDAPVIPVIVLSDVEHAVPLARALVAGGIRLLEVITRTMPPGNESKMPPDERKLLGAWVAQGADTAAK